MLCRRNLALALVGVATIAAGTTGCASIVSKSDWPVTIASAEPDVPFTIRDETGIAVSQGRTPTTVTLSASTGYFNGADYRVESPGGITPLTSRLNGWYLGNIVFGGLIGLLIVDPATGAMWKLPATVSLPTATN